MDKKQTRSYHGRNGLRHYIVEPGLCRLADSEIESILGMCHDQLGRYAPHMYVWIHKLSDFSKFRKYVKSCKKRVCVL